MSRASVALLFVAALALVACRRSEGGTAAPASAGSGASPPASAGHQPPPPAAPSASSVVIDARFWSPGPNAIELGELPIPSGEVVVVDPGVLQGAVRVAIPPGTYRVRLARTPERSVESAAIVAPSAAPVRWEEVGAYAVDAGMSGFFDAGVFARVQRATWKRNIYDDLIAQWLEPAEKQQRGRGGVLVPFEKDTFSACSSGDGDGLYSVYAGRDARGMIVAVVTSFLWPDE